MKAPLNYYLSLGITVLLLPLQEQVPAAESTSDMDYSVEAIKESGERGGRLLAVGDQFRPEYNREMGQAMALWNAHRWEEARDQFHRIWQEHPDSPWAAEAELHEACFNKFRGHFDQAEDRFLSLLNKFPQSAELRAKVLHYLPDLYAMTGRLEDAYDALGCLERMTTNWQELQFVENYRRLYARHLLKNQNDRLCGAKALAFALAASENPGQRLRNVSISSVQQRYAWGNQPAQHPDGYSLAELAKLGKGRPLRISLEQLRQAAQAGSTILVYLDRPAQARSWSVLEKPKREKSLGLTGHFLVVEEVHNAHLDVLDPDGGRSRWPMQLFLYRWSGTVLELPGQNFAGSSEIPLETAGAMRGGCCGSPPPDPSDECGENGNSSGGGGGAGGGFSKLMGFFNGWSGGACPTCGGAGGSSACCPDLGAPNYYFGLSSANLQLRDIPMWFPSAKGPDLYIQLTYNRTDTERMRTNARASYRPFGHKWTFNLGSYYMQDPGGGIEIMLPRGRSEKFLYDGGAYVADDLWNKNNLVRSEPWLILTFHDSGSKWYFDTTTQNLARIEDIHGNPITFTYTSGRLQYATDAVGRSFYFMYDSNGKVTNINDSLGRNARFSYSAAGDLVSMTDMGGLTTYLSYDSNHYVTNMVYPNNSANRILHQRTGLYSYLSNNISYWYVEPYRMRVIDSLSQTNEYFYHGFGVHGPMTLTDRIGNTWAYGQKDASHMNVRRIYHELVNATTQQDWHSGDQWSYTHYDTSYNPLNIYLANDSNNLWFKFDDEEPTYGAVDQRVTMENSYDDRNNLLTTTLITNPSGVPQTVGVWSNCYYPGTDLLQRTVNPLRQTNSYGYDAKEQLTAFTNALNQVTRLAYDQNGNLTNRVDALSTNRWVYDSNSGQLTDMYLADGHRFSYGYDSIGRQTNLTDHGAGLSLSYSYDDLDRLTQIIYPDSAYTFSFSCCGLESVTDRLGRTTYYTPDAIGRIVAITDPLQHTLGLAYNGADQITNLTTTADGIQRVKRFHYTSTNGFSRLTSVVYPSGSKSNSYHYTFRGWLKTMTNGNGLVVNYEYDDLGRLTHARTNGVTKLGLEYNVLGIPTNLTSANSRITILEYDALNRPTRIESQIINLPSPYTSVTYRIENKYDTAGNVRTQIVTGLSGWTGSITITNGFDSMNRLTRVAQSVGGSLQAAADYQYDAAGRLWRKSYGNNDQVTHGYDAESGLRVMEATNAGASLFQYGYAWNANGHLVHLTNGALVTTYGYDAIGQLTNEIDGSVNRRWVYDEAGNSRDWPEPNRQAAYNVDDELVLSSANVTVPVSGHVQPGANNSKWFNTWAECRGVTAQVNTNTGDFTLPNVPLYPGTNQLVVTVTDVSGNSSQQTRTVINQHQLQGYGYDGNGSRTQWTNGATVWTYVWNWADQLTEVRSNSAPVLKCWYDGQGRRVAKEEVVGGQTQRWLYLYSGWSVIAVLNETGSLRETYTRGVGLAGDIGTIVAVTHHAGSGVTPGTYYVHHNHRGDVVMTRSGTSTFGAHAYAAYGTIRSQSGTRASRFLFSSKELDESVGLYYYGFRFYDPNVQRWMSRDPIGEAGGLNLYGFVMNNPVSYIDTDGRLVESASVSGVATCVAKVAGGVSALGIGAAIGAGVAVGFLGDFIFPPGPPGPGMAPVGNSVRNRLPGAIAMPVGKDRSKECSEQRRERCQEAYSNCLMYGILNKFGKMWEAMCEHAFQRCLNEPDRSIPFPHTETVYPDGTIFTRP